MSLLDQNIEKVPHLSDFMFQKSKDLAFLSQNLGCQVLEMTDRG